MGIQQFECPVERLGEMLLVRPRGTLDERTAAQFESAVREAGIGPGLRLIVDLRAVAQIDGSGMRALGAAREIADAGAARFAVIPGIASLDSGRVGELFEILPGDPPPATRQRIARRRAARGSPLCELCGEPIGAEEELSWQRPDGSMVEPCPPLVREMVTLWDERVAYGALSHFFHRRCRVG